MAETLPAIDETPAGPQPAAACGSDAVARRAQVRPALRLQTLEELAGIGMDLARTLGRQATEAAETGPGAAPAPDMRPDMRDVALAFSRLSRAVRQTLGLEAKLEGELAARDAEAMAQAAARRPEDDEARVRRMRVVIHKVTVQDAVEEAIKAEARDGVEVERLLGELDERLEAEDLDDDLDDGSIAEVVERVCNDLGVAFDLNLWAGEDWADEAAGEPDEASYAAGAGRSPGAPWPAAPWNAPRAAWPSGVARGRRPP